MKTPIDYYHITRGPRAKRSSDSQADRGRNRVAWQYIFAIVAF
jgi:hypothetical protein